MGGSTKNRTDPIGANLESHDIRFLTVDTISDPYLVKFYLTRTGQIYDKLLVHSAIILDRCTRPPLPSVAQLYSIISQLLYIVTVLVRLLRQGGDS